MIVTNIFNKLVNILAAMAAVLIILTTLIVAYTILIRFLAGIPGLAFIEDYTIKWSWQFAEHSMVWFPFLAAPWLLRQHKHVSVDLILNMLSERIKRKLYVLHGILGIILCLGLAYFCTIVTMDNFRRNIMEVQVVDLPKWLLLVVLPVSFAVLTVQFVQNLVISIKKLREPESSAKTTTTD